MSLRPPTHDPGGADTLLSRGWLGETWRTSTHGREQRVRFVTVELPWDRLAHERVAVGLARYHLPVPTDYSIDEATRTSRMSWLPGEPEGWTPAAARAVGDVLARIETIRLPGYGTDVRGDAFVARASTWRDEWAWFAGAWDRIARDGGVHVPDALAARIDASAALDHARVFSLVHHDLHPGNLLFIAGELSGVVDWEGAIAGDPLVDWAQPLLFPPPRLADVVAGYGPERVRSWLDDPATIERLEIYRATRLLVRLGGSSLGVLPAATRRAMIESVSVPRDDVRTQLARALDQRR